MRGRPLAAPGACRLLGAGRRQRVEIDASSDHSDPVARHAQAFDVPGLVSGVGGIAGRPHARSADARTRECPFFIGMNGAVQHDGHAPALAPRCQLVHVPVRERGRVDRGRSELVQRLTEAMHHGTEIEISGTLGAGIGEAALQRPGAGGSRRSATSPWAADARGPRRCPRPRGRAVRSAVRVRKPAGASASVVIT